MNFSFLPPPRPRPKILIVDDEPELVRVLTVRLRAAGYETVSAGDGAGAESKALLDQPDLVLLDIGLPGGDGYEVLETLRSQGETAHMPIVFLTARTWERERATAMHPDGYLLKPYQSDVLLELVGRLTAAHTASGLAGDAMPTSAFT